MAGVDCVAKEPELDQDYFLLTCLGNNTLQAQEEACVG